MKITLILPSMGKYKDGRCISSWRMQPLTMAVLAGLTPSGTDIRFYDDRIEKIPFDEPADLIVMSVETFTAKRAYEISGEYRKRNVPVVMGGFHPTLCPEEAGEHADSIAVGEAENHWLEILDDARNDRLKKVYFSGQRPSLSGVKPDRRIFSGKRYLPINLVEFGRGCKHECNFCSITSFYRGSYRHRPVEDVIGEIKGLDDKLIFFVDDNLIADPDAAKELLRALLPMRKKWVTQCSIAAADNDELLALMAESGCIAMLVGLESLNNENLFQMGKRLNRSAEDVESRLKKIRGKGIKVYATFLFGYDNDDEKVCKDTVKFAVEQKFFITGFNNLTPFPGTGYYNELESQGRLTHERWWLDRRYKYGDIPIKLKNMPSEELAELCVRMRTKFYSIPSIMIRMLDLKANCRNLNFAVFLYINLMLRNEVKNKLEISLGKSNG
ncbi:MAG: radical SAM protein [Syntrophorhabdaceae bacterium]|nr:radical SAM protein [Syntrophorhabdaceae bacterium]